MRKFDKHLVPWLFGLWLLAFIDRSNIGNPRSDGLLPDLELMGNQFNIVSHRSDLGMHSFGSIQLNPSFRH